MLCSFTCIISFELCCKSNDLFFGITLLLNLITIITGELKGKFTARKLYLSGMLLNYHK